MSRRLPPTTPRPDSPGSNTSTPTSMRWRGRLDSTASTAWGARRVKEGKLPLDAGENVEPKPAQIKRLRKSQVVRDGSAAW